MSVQDIHTYIHIIHLHGIYNRIILLIVCGGALVCVYGPEKTFKTK